jgi:hypothetical protein
MAVFSRVGVDMVQSNNFVATFIPPYETPAKSADVAELANTQLAGRSPSHPVAQQQAFACAAALPCA